MQELSDVRPWPYDRPAKVTIELKNGDKISEFCEAALGSSARPLEHQTVLEKINHLSKSIAPNLESAVVSLRQQIQNNHSFSLKTNEWINSFYNK
jgi:hypothetical protein